MTWMALGMAWVFVAGASAGGSGTEAWRPGVEVSFPGYSMVVTGRSAQVRWRDPGAIVRRRPGGEAVGGGGEVTFRAKGRAAEGSLGGRNMMGLVMVGGATAGAVPGGGGEAGGEGEDEFAGGETWLDREMEAFADESADRDTRGGRAVLAADGYGDEEMERGFGRRWMGREDGEAGGRGRAGGAFVEAWSPGWNDGEGWWGAGNERAVNGWGGQDLPVATWGWGRTEGGVGRAGRVGRGWGGMDGWGRRSAAPGLHGFGSDGSFERKDAGSGGLGGWDMGGAESAPGAWGGAGMGFDAGRGASRPGDMPGADMGGGW